MAQQVVNVRVELDREIDLSINKWADSEGRSKRRHVAILARKLVQLAKENPSELVRLGLMDKVVRV